MPRKTTIGVAEKFTGLEDAEVLLNGDIAFTVKTAVRKKLRVYCSPAEVGDIFGFLAHLAKAAGQTRSVPPPTTPRGYNPYLEPVPAQAIRLQAGSAGEPDEALLVVRLYGFDLTFSIPQHALARLADEFPGVVSTLLPGGEKKLR